MKRKKLPARHYSYNLHVDNVHITIGEYPDGSMGEVFMDASKEGTWTKAVLNSLAMSISLGLQHGTPLSAFVKTFRDAEPRFLSDLFLELESRYAKTTADPGRSGPG